MMSVLSAAISGLANMGLEKLGFYLALGVLISFVEEVFFRGLILRSLRQSDAMSTAAVCPVGGCQTP
ncbi:MAG: hypothetical protein H7270_15875 [Dermatophilaceae bacterium]|nr:hypothetical protein [Dermatophilaceae bacterium]